MKQSLVNIALLDGLPVADLAALVKRCRWRSFDANEQVLAHLDAGTDLLFLTEGRLRVSLYSSSGKEVSFEDLGPGQHFGEMAAIDRKGRSASVFALEPCTVAFLSSHEASRHSNLVELFDGEVISERKLWLLTHRDLRNSERVKTFMRFITENLVME